TYRFDLSSFSNGIYTVAVNAGNSNLTYRLVLNKLSVITHYERAVRFGRPFFLPLHFPCHSYS
ncbi:MAG: hypothetical protein ACKOX7_04790, partial [Bacteroidota bacterium]